MSLRLLRLSFFLLLYLVLTVFYTAANPIRGEFWIRDDLMDISSPGSNLRERDELSERQKNALNELLEDARWTFSGMIYGYSVHWTPSSGNREVNEEFNIEPLALIPRGDSRMKTVSITRENGFVYILLEYSPDAGQEKRLEGWQGETFPAAAGTGIVPFGNGARRNALKAAIKETLRAYLRAREYNRPREINGRVAFTDFPVTGLSGGSFRASVSLRMDLEPLKHYSVD